MFPFQTRNKFHRVQIRTTKHFFPSTDGFGLHQQLNDDVLLLGKITLVIGTTDQGIRAPNYLWPLGNTTVYREVIVGHDAHLPENNQCYKFQPGYPGLPYDAVTLGELPSSYLDFQLTGAIKFQDLSISVYVYPEGPEPKGTLLSYKCASGNVIRVTMMDGLLFVSFWDEYGVSVGMTAIPGLLKANVWNHVVLIRNFATGNIKMYHDGELVEDLDDDFPNGIQLPVIGVMRLGRGQDAENDGLAGRYVCLQFFAALLTRDDVMKLADFCKPPAWKVQPKVHLQTRPVDGENKQCVTDYIPPVLDEPAVLEPVKTMACDVLGLQCLTGGVAWQSVLSKYNWSDSGRDTVYFYIVSRNVLPASSETRQHLLGSVVTSDHRVCSHLCMRVRGCRSFAYSDTRKLGVQCFLYDSVVEAKEPSDGSRYYAMRIETSG